jgi:hypothetical protein
MAEQSFEFYSVWPILDGKPLNLQWSNQRANTANTKAIVRGSVQDVGAGDELNALRSLIGMEFGDVDFKNKFRFHYNKTTLELTLQKNDGTVASPVWTDCWQVRFNDGQFQSVGQGGITSAAGFYGPGLQSLREVAESGSAADVSILNPTKLFFNADDGLGVQAIASGANAGAPEVRFNAPFGKAQTFARSGKEWEVQHNFGTSPLMVQVMDSDRRVVIPDKADVSDPNTAYFYFHASTTGEVLIASGGTGAVSLVPRDPFYLVARTNTDSSDNRLMQPNAHLVFDASFFYVDVDLDTDAGGARKQAFVSLHSSPEAVAANDHGALTGLNDDDHTNYVLADGTRAIEGTLAGDLIVQRTVKAEAFYLAQAGGISNDTSDNIIICPDGSYVLAESNLIAGDPGTEGDAISVGGINFESVLKASDIASPNEVSLHLHRHSTTLQPVIMGSRSKSATNAHGNVADGDLLLSLIASGWSTSTYELAGQIDFQVEGTPSAGIVPGKIVFRTSPGSDIGFSPPTAMTIHSDKHVRMENTLNVENSITAEAFYLSPGSGGELSQSGDDLLIKARDGQVVIDDALRVTDKVVAANFYSIGKGEPAYNFLDHPDTPSTYSGSAAKLAVVNATEDAIEFTAATVVDAARFVVIDARKGSPGTINKGEAVYISGYNASGFVEIEAAQADAAATMPAIGLASEDIDNSTTGQVVTAGQVIGTVAENLDTSGFSDGDEVYIDPDTAGQLTVTKPTGTNLIQSVAEILRAHGSLGVIEVFGAGRTNDIPNIPFKQIWIGASTSLGTATSLDAIPHSIRSTEKITAEAFYVASGGELNADQWLFPDGADGAPGIALASEPTSGIYKGAIGTYIQDDGTDTLILSGPTVFANGAIRTTQGTVAAPSHSFTNDADSGMYRSFLADNILGFAFGGKQVMTLGSKGARITGSCTAEAFYVASGSELNADQFLCPDGAAGAPGIAFVGEPNSGIRRGPLGTIISDGGTDTIDIRSSACHILGNLLTTLGTAASPSHTFSSDSDTGMYRSFAADNILGFAFAGKQVMTLGSEGAKITGSCTAAGFYMHPGANGIGHGLNEDTISFDIPSVLVDNYWLESFVPQAFIIEDVQIITQSGSCTAAFYIHGDGETHPGVSITGLDPISASTTKASAIATALNIVNPGDSLVLSVPTNSSAEHLRGRLKIKLSG